MDGLGIGACGGPNGGVPAYGPPVVDAGDGGDVDVLGFDWEGWLKLEEDAEAPGVFRVDYVNCTGG